MFGIFKIYPQLVSEIVDEISESETFDVDDDIIINVNNLLKNIPDPHFCKICTIIEIKKKFLNFIMYLEKFEEELF